MTKIIQRHDTAANWASVNPVLAQGEMGIETDTRKFKFGDGATAWADLAYASSEGGGGSTSYTFTDGIVNNDNIVGLDSNLYSKIFVLNTVGTPTLSDKFVGGGFTNSSYFTSKSFLDGTEDSWEMCFKFDFATVSQDIQGILDGDNTTTGQNIRLTISSANKLFLRINSSLSSNTYALALTGSTTLSINTIYYVKIKYSSSTGYTMHLSTNGTDYMLDASSTITTKLLYSTSVVWLYGKNAANVPLTGNIYFEDSYIIRNNTERISFVNTFSDYNKSLNKPKINNVELSGNNTSTDLGLQDVFSTENPINIRVETISSTKNIAVNKDANTVTASSKQSLEINAGNIFHVSASSTDLGKKGVVFNNYIALPVDANTIYVNNTNNIILGYYLDDGSFYPKFIFGAAGGGYDGAFICTSITNSGNYKEVQVVNLTLSSAIRNSTLTRAIRVDKANNTIYLSNTKSGGTKPCVISNESYINELQQCTTVMLVSNQSTLDYGLKNTNSYWIGALKYDSTEFKIPTNSEAASLVKRYPDDATVTRYLNLKVDNSTIKVNSSGKLEAIPQKVNVATVGTVGVVKPDGSTITIAEDGTISSTGGGGSSSIATTDTAGIVKPDGSTITVTNDGTISSVAPANMITTDNIASDATISAMNNNLTTLSTDVTTLKNKITFPKIISGAGKILDANGDTTEGYGRFNAILYQNGKCRIDFTCRIEVAGTASGNFEWGINIDLLKAINSGLPTIIPEGEGLASYFNSSGIFPEHENGYAGSIHATESGKRWMFGRMYKTNGILGAWSSEKFTVGTYIVGYILGTF